MKKILFLIILIFIVGCAKVIEEKAEMPIQEAEKIEATDMKLSSSAFENNGIIPSEYTCDGENISPQLMIEDIPNNTKSLALTLDDINAPKGVFTHWIVFNIPPDIAEIAEGEDIAYPQGKTSFGKQGYGGPCPPSGTHRYVFQLYALDIELELEQGASKQEVEKAMQGHVTAKAELVGKYR